MPGILQLIDRSPYLRAPLDDWSDIEVEEITIMGCAQFGKTTFLQGCCSYAIANDPGRMLFCMPNEKDAKAFAKGRLQPVFRDTKPVRKKIPKTKGDFNVLEMNFPKMPISVVGANSPARLAQRPCRFALSDEPDKYPLGNKREAAATLLIRKRVRAYKGRRKMANTSTPTTSTGYIYKRFMAGDRRRYFVPCPHCKKRQVLVWANVKKPDDCKTADGDYDWEKIKAGTKYQCAHCDELIDESFKRWMLNFGQWRATNPNPEPGHRSYHLSALCVRWESWGDLMMRWLKAQPYPDELRDFLNSELGEPWEDRGRVATETKILEHRADYDEGSIPEKPHAVVMTVDRQEDGNTFKYVIRAWCDYETSYLVRYGKVFSEEELKVVHDGLYFGPDGLPIAVTHCFVDSSAFTSDTYNLCRRNRWYPLKGDDTDEPYEPWKFSKLPGAQLFVIRVNFFKDLLQDRLRMGLGLRGSWYLHRATGKDYAFELTGEEKRLEIIKRNGREIWKWHYVHVNDLLDCEVYQLAAVHWLGIRFLSPDGGPVRKPATGTEEFESKFRKLDLRRNGGTHEQESSKQSDR